MNLQIAVRRALTEAAQAADSFDEGKTSEEGLRYCASKLAKIMCEIMFDEPFEIQYRQPSGKVGVVGLRPSSGDGSLTYLTESGGNVCISETEGMGPMEASADDLIAFINDAPLIIAQMAAS